jgi:hypothetical protein
VTLQSKPAEMRDIVMSKKASAAVSSWGFSGYITVLPKENKPDALSKKEEFKEKPKCQQEPKSR